MTLNQLIESIKKSKTENKLVAKPVVNLLKKSNRKGTQLSYKNIYIYAKQIPFIHNTNPKSFYQILRSKRLLSYKELKMDKEVSGISTNTYPIDIKLGTHRNVFFTWGIPCSTCNTGFYFLVSYDKMKNNSAYAQMKDVYFIFRDLIDKKIIPYDEFENSQHDEETIEIIKKSMKKNRFTIKDFIKVQAYLMWRFAAKYKISNLEQLQRSYFADMVKKDRYAEVHVRSEFNILNADKIVYYDAGYEKELMKKIFDLAGKLGIRIINSGEEYFRVGNAGELIEIFHEEY